MKKALLIFALALGVYTLTAGGHLYSPDEEILFRTTSSLYENHSLAVDASGLGGFGTRRGTDGEEYAQYGIGQPILAIPFYAIGKAVAKSASDEDWQRFYGIADDENAARRFPHPTNDIAPRFACSFFNIFVAAFLAGILYLLLFELTQHSAASLLTALLYAFGTLAWAHSRPFFSETLAVFFILASWLALLKSTRSRSALLVVLAGLMAGCSALVRMDSVLMYPGLALVLIGPVRHAFQPIHSKFHAWFLFGIPAAICGAILLLLNILHFGGPFVTGYADQPEGIHFSAPVLAGLYGFLFSAGKGLFFFSPPLILSLWSWGAMTRRNVELTAGVALSVIVPLVAMSKWQNWAGGWCWGPRHIFMIHPFLAIPIAFWLAENWGPAKRILAVSLLAVGVGVQLLGCSQDFIEFYRRFFRDPRPEAHAHVLYDAYDQQYWEQFYRLNSVPANQQVPLSWSPAPTQHSVYLPQSSVWSCYPRMWREGQRDNLWLRLARHPPRS